MTCNILRIASGPQTGKTIMAVGIAHQMFREKIPHVYFVPTGNYVRQMQMFHGMNIRFSYLRSESELCSAVLLRNAGIRCVIIDDVRRCGFTERTMLDMFNYLDQVPGPTQLIRIEDQS